MVIYFMTFMNSDFIFKFFILQSKKIYTLKLIVALNFSFLRHGICFQSFFPSFFKADFHSANVGHTTDAVRWQMVFFWQSYRLEELRNRLLTKWNLSQAFLFDFTLIYIFDGVYICDSECLDLFTYKSRLM